MLRRMSRRVTRAETEQLLDKMRDRIPQLALRTTMIAGFPGETEDQFQEMVQFVSERRFERLGVFTYSFEPDTPAALLPDHVAEDVKNERRDQLMQVQQQVAFEWNQSLVGKRVDVMLDGPVPGERHVWIGRTCWDAPDVDSQVFVTDQRQKLSAGRFVPCEIVTSQDYDLVAAAVGPPH
jgi:ribosomal protein S12 methylthiotransferase